MKTGLAIICSILVSFILIISGCSSPKACFQSGKCVSLEVMKTQQEKANGLMFREFISGNEGMLFLNDNPVKSCMWMKNMNFAIDILWLDGNGSVLYIESSVPPCRNESCAVYCHEGKDVLELQAGFAATHNIKSGERVVFS